MQESTKELLPHLRERDKANDPTFTFLLPSFLYFLLLKPNQKPEYK
jgi:hypothetical protein